MPKISKFKRPQILDALRLCRDAGLDHIEIAAKLGMTKSSVATYSCRYGITGWPQGAAARDQTGSKNPAFKNGLSRATIARTTKNAVIDAGKSLFTCERCGVKRNLELPRHHRNRDRSDNEIGNIEVLCVPCHNREHMPERTRDEFGRLVAK